MVTVQGGDGFSGFQPLLRTKIGKNQAQLGQIRLFQELKPLFSHAPLNAYGHAGAEVPASAESSFSMLDVVLPSPRSATHPRKSLVAS